MAVGDGPQPHRGQQHERVHHDRVGDGEEAQRADAEDQRRDGDEGVGGVEVAAEQEPRHPGAELAAPEPPLVEVVEALGPAPPRGEEAQDRDDQEQDDEDGERDTVDAVHLRAARTSL
jgi:hypothetical protein